MILAMAEPSGLSYLGIGLITIGETIRRRLLPGKASTTTSPLLSSPMAPVKVGPAPLRVPSGSLRGSANGPAREPLSVDDVLRGRAYVERG